MSEPPRMSGPDSTRVSRARAEALKRYPGPIGRFLAAELKFWQLFGWRLGGHSMVMALVDELLKTEAEAA